MSLTFDQLKKRVGKNLKYYDDTGGWLTGRDVTEDDIGEYINEIYREILFPMFATQYPHYFEQIATTDSHISTGTAGASSTGTTLVATTAIFTNAMVGLTVYNSTDDTSAKIESYTSTTVVTLDTTIGDTWDGDTVYVLGKEFSYGGNATDFYVIRNVSVKYNSTDSYYRQAEPRYQEDFLQYGNEEGSELRPFSYETTLNISGTPSSAVGIIPGFTKKVDGGLQITYIGKPVALSADGDVMRLPVDTPVIYLATQRAFEKKREYDEASYWLQRGEREKDRALSQYRPLNTGRNMKIKVPRRYADIFNGRI